MQTILGDRRKDRLALVYSSSAGFLLVGFYWLLLKFSGWEELTCFLITFAIFAVGFDVRHFFPTYSRTLFDSQFMGKNKGWYTISWLLILILPILSFVLISSGEYFVFNSYIAVSFLLRATYVLGFYHLVKQNWGFMAIYKKKFSEPEDGSDRWEKLLILSGAFIPFVLLSLFSPVWFSGDEFAFTPSGEQLAYVTAVWKRIGAICLVGGIFFGFIGFVIKVLPQFKYVSRNLAYFLVFCFLLINSIFRFGADNVLLSLVVLLVLIFLFSAIKVIQRERTLKDINKEKWLVFFSAMVLYGVVFMLPIENKFILAMAVTIPHDIQYLSFTRVFAKNYYSNSQKDHGLASRLAQRTILFVVLSFIYAIVFETARTGVRLLPQDPSNLSMDYYRNMVSVFFIGMVLHHYYLDAVIWRVRKDDDLKNRI